MPTPVAGFNKHPENINREGRPKRKTLTELIHAKLDDTPDAWEAVIRVVLEKLIKEKDPQILKTFWQYTDGMPQQKVEMTAVMGTQHYIPQKDYGNKSNKAMEANSKTGESTTSDK